MNSVIKTMYVYTGKNKRIVVSCAPDFENTMTECINTIVEQLKDNSVGGVDIFTGVLEPQVIEEFLNKLREIDKNMSIRLVTNTNLYNIDCLGDGIKDVYTDLLNIVALSVN